MVTEQEILDYYTSLCKLSKCKLTRAEYRKLNPMYSSSLIERIWGSWSNFINVAEVTALVVREDRVRKFTNKDDKIVITYAVNGCPINVDFLETLEKYCEVNGAKLGILWGKSIKKNDTFSKDVFLRIDSYLATKFEFEKDKNCLVQDFLIPHTQKNPLLNLDKFSTNISTIIVGSTKQYLRILPYKQYNQYRIGCSTGTISEVDYKQTISGCIDLKYHTYGAILLTFDKKAKRYVVRNLMYKDGKICDLNVEYTSKKVSKIKNVPTLVLGDLHLPEEDNDSIEATREQFKLLSPENVMIHDIASWNSISHHEANKHLTRCKNKTEETFTLEKEIETVVKHLTSFTKGFEHIKFNVVNSNHDGFIEKWLDTGEFVKDTANAKIGAKLFLQYLDNKNIFSSILPKNFKMLRRNESFNILGYELSEHGDCGISGARGSINSFNKSFEKIVIGHTHSPEIFEKTIVVGTLSKLKLNYNQQGMTTWCAANAVIHNNGTFQLLFL